METKNTQPRSKIVFVLPSLSAGGAERVLITLMNGLDRALFNPVFMNVISKGSLKNLIQPDIKTIDLKQNGVFRALPALLKTLKAEQPDIVVSTMAHMNFTLLLLRPLFPKTKFIVREAIVPSYILKSHPLFAPLIRLAYGILYRQADAIISPSQLIIDEFRNGLGLSRENHILLYNPVDTAYIATKSWIGGRGAANQNGVNFIASGRLDAQKGFDRLIEALKNFNPPFNWHLSILGEGDQKNRLQFLIDQNNLKHNISLRGHIENPWTDYAQADCLLLPSRWEGMPNVALEALACGTPVIASSDAGGIGEIASFAENDSVRVAKTMADFVGMMEQAPQFIPPSKLSLLPQAFQKDHIDKQFKELLLKASA